MSQKILEQKMSESQKSVARVQEAMAKVNSKFEQAAQSETGIDIESADLAAVHAHTDTMNANIAELIMGLDDITNSFSNDFNEMRNKTSMEKFVGIFARGKSEAMRQERVRASSIEDKLFDLVKKSNVISALLGEQLTVLREERTKVEANLDTTYEQRIQTVEELDDVRTQLNDLGPILSDLEIRLAAAGDNVTRTRLETELSEKNKNYNELKTQEQVLITKSQTLERYIDAGKTWVESLQGQEGTQLVLISKLEVDTQQRVVLYDALIKSLKTAQQQDVAHRVNEIGVKTDHEAQVAMAAIGAATGSRMLEMMENHEGHMVRSRDILQKQAAVNERFDRRFAEIVRKHDSNLYQQ